MNRILLALTLCLAFAASARADITIRNLQPSGAYVSLYDVYGNVLDVREGLLTQHGVADGPLYYYGECSNGFTPGAAGAAFCGFNVYKCQNATGGTDLLNCTFQGSMLDPTDSTIATRCAATTNTYNGCWRPKVVFNSANNNYILWYYKFVHGGPNVWYSHVCTSPTGGCGAGTARTAALTSTPGDGTVFVDDNGTDAYWVYNDQPGSVGSPSVYVEKLNSTFTAGLGSGSAVDTGLGGLEAPVMFRNGSNYYVGGAGTCPNCAAGAASPTLRRATTALGTYGNAVVINSANGCSSQPVSISKIVAGSQTTFLYVGDRFGGQGNLGQSSPYFHPLTFSGADPVPFSCDATVTVAGITGSVYPTPPPGYFPADQSNFQGSEFRDFAYVDATHQLMQTFVPTAPTIFNVLLALGKTTTGCTPGGADGGGTACTLPNPDGSLEVDLVTVDGSNNPVSTIATTTIPASQINYPSKATIVPLKQTVTSGNKYGIVLKAVGLTVGQYTVAAASPNSSIYPSGLLRNSTNSGSTWGTFSNASIMFETFAAPTYNVANAPAWQASTSYTHVAHLGDRVLAGPGLTPGVTPAYTNGSALYLLELTQAGTSDSTNQPTIPTCPTSSPAGIPDGTAIWRCLTKVDYITYSSAEWDDPVQWQPNVGACTNDNVPQPGCYWSDQIVINAGYAWRMCYWSVNFSGSCGHPFLPSSAPFKCVAASSGPGPTNPAVQETDGPGCAWSAIAKIPYTSDPTHASAYTHQVQSQYPYTGERPDLGRRAVIGAGTPGVVMTITLWHGGFAAQTYTGGVGNETNPLRTAFHTAFVNGDNSPYCDNTLATTTDTGCGFFEHGNTAIIIAPAPGESFRDNLISTDPLAIDQTKGVTFIGASQTGITSCDIFTTVNGLQIKTTGGIAAFGDLNACQNNVQNVYNSILDSDGITTYGADGFNVSGNNLIINRSNAAGASAIFWKYNGWLWNTTLISLGSGANRTAIQNVCGDIFGLQYKDINNNLFFGWSHLAATDTNCFPTWSTTKNSNNSTDLPNEAGGATFTETYINNNTLTVQTFGGTSSLFNQNAAATFVDVATNPRLSAGSSARGAGASYISDFRTNATDMFGTPRP